MKKLFLSIALAATALPALTQPAPQREEMDRFVSSLMQRMTLREKLGQINLLPGDDITTGGAVATQLSTSIAAGELGGVFNIKGVEKIRALQEIAVKKSRLGIPLIIGMDVIHGYETVLPIPLAQSCTWDTAAVERGARMTATEATADGISWVYSPMVDVATDPRWGRMAEGYGEDPYLSAQMGAAMVRGLQNNTSGAKDRSVEGGFYSDHAVMACLKHYALYGAVEAGRDYNTVDMSHVRMYNQYFLPYKAAVEAGVGSVMTSFNLVDGVPATANRWLVTDVLRQQWNFGGFVVTDYGSIGEMTNHGLGDLKSNSALALDAGTDMDMCAQGYISTLEQSLAEGRVTMAQIDTACRRVLEAKYRLGLFADPYRYLDARRRKTDIYTDEHRRTARDLAAETFVLLKNEGNVLPLKREGRIALIGPMADERANIVGTWSVAATPSRYRTLREAMAEAVKGRATLLYAQGCNVVNDSVEQAGGEWGNKIPRVDADAAAAEALRMAGEADVIVCAMGETAEMSGESSSRARLTLPDAQRALLRQLVETGKPVVLLNFAGRATILNWENEHVEAILNVWFPGSETADAICDVLFGDKCPSGKLTVTMPQAEGQLPLYYNALPTGRRVADDTDHFLMYQSNYLDVRNDPLYPFGYGLSYTTFSYSAPCLSSTTLRDSLTVSVSVKNTGERAADEVVQLYINDPVARVSRPIKELKAFRRIHLEAGESKDVVFTVTPDMLKYYDSQLRYALDRGKFVVMTGPDSKHVQRAEFEY